MLQEDLIPMAALRAISLSMSFELIPSLYIKNMTYLAL